MPPSLMQPDDTQDDRLLRIGDAAEFLGVSIDTLRRWDRAGTLVPHERSGPQGQRRYLLSDLMIFQETQQHAQNHAMRIITYARVISENRRDLLERQQQRLEQYATYKNLYTRAICDIGPAVNAAGEIAPGLQQVIAAIERREAKVIAVAHQTIFGWAQWPQIQHRAVKAHVRIVRCDPTAEYVKTLLEDDLAYDGHHLLLPYLKFCESRPWHMGRPKP